MKLRYCECSGTPMVKVGKTPDELYSVFCPNCKSSTSTYRHYKDAQRMWNNLCWKSEYCVPKNATA